MDIEESRILKLIFKFFFLIEKATYVKAFVGRMSTKFKRAIVSWDGYARGFIQLSLNCFIS